ncbi:MAG: hypothetical protein JW801_16510 [Bacteroidales bacterium]|nr:hypothetical protein [Bacteroidales bacterium]
MIIKSGHIIFVLLACLLLGIPMEPADAQAWRWIMLAQREVDYSLGSDVIEFGSRESRYAVLQLRLVDGTMNLYDIEIEYKDGYREEIPVTHSFRPGNDIVVIPIPDRLRIIKSITIYYDTDNYSQNAANLLVFGSR